MTDEQPLRCARCGIESRERSCFIVPRPFGPPPREVRCVSCEVQRMNRRSTRLYIAIGCVLALLPLALLWAGWPLRDALLAVVLLPAAVTAHELGHALTALLLGMEMGGMDIGYGRVLIRFRLGAMPVRIHAIVLSGRVYYGARSFGLLRLRAWLCVAMGPMTNAALLVAVIVWPQRAEALAGPLLPYAWLAVNGMLLSSLLPADSVVRGQRVRTDGLELMQIPFRRREELQVFLTSAPAMRALDRLDCEDLAGTRRWVQAALARSPGDVLLTRWLAACHNYSGEHLRAARLLTQVLPGSAADTAVRRAGLRGDVAFTLLMAHACEPGELAALEEADRLSAEVFAMFPCLLEYRSTRALVLCVRQRPAEALALLDYVHYAHANRRQAGAREMARALALRMLDRPEEAREAGRRAVQSFAVTRGWLKSLGMDPEPGVR